VLWFGSPDPHCFSFCFHSTVTGQQTTGQIHQQLLKVNTALPSFTASTKLSQALALPSIPQLPVVVANYQTLVINSYKPEIKNSGKKRKKKKDQNNGSAIKIL